jgi:hypothetical protein
MPDLETPSQQQQQITVDGPPVTPPKRVVSAPAAPAAPPPASDAFTPGVKNLQQEMARPPASGGMAGVEPASLYGEVPANPDAQQQVGNGTAPGMDATYNTTVNQNMAVPVNLREYAQGLVTAFDELIGYLSALGAAYDKPSEHAGEFRMSQPVYSGTVQALQTFLASRPHLVNDSGGLVVMLIAHFTQTGINIYSTRKLNIELKRVQAEAETKKAEAEIMLSQSRILEYQRDIARYNALPQQPPLAQQQQPAYTPPPDEKKKWDEPVLTQTPPQYQRPVAPAPRREGDPVHTGQQALSGNKLPRQVSPTLNTTAPKSPDRAASFALEAHHVVKAGIYKKSHFTKAGDKKPAWNYVSTDMIPAFGETLQMFRSMTFRGKWEDCPEHLRHIFFEAQGKPYTMERVAMNVLRDREPAYVGVPDTEVRNELEARTRAAMQVLTRTTRLPV